MRFRNLNKWDDPAGCTPLIYFAQLLDEMLFDFSLDTYKASVMHTGLLCREAIQTIKNVEQGNIKEPNVWHVTAELLANFEKDTVALALTPLPISAFQAALKNTKTPLKELTTILELLSLQLSTNAYRQKTEELLAIEVTGSGRVSQLRRLARSYVTALIADGFTSTHLRKVMHEFFYFGANRIGSNDAIHDYFALFPAKPRAFTVVFRLHDVFEHMAEAFTPLDIKIARSLPSEINLSQYPTFAAGTDAKLYGIVSNIEALDVHGARQTSENRIKLCSTLISLFHHKENPRWQPECVVIDNENKAYKLIRSPINSMHKCSDLLQPVASKRLRLLMSEFSLEKNSFSKFVRSAELHSMALGSDAKENQILNLWISLESLVPSETKSDAASNIEHIVKSIVPFLNIEYFERLLKNLGKDMLRWNGFVTKRALRSVPGQKLTDKLVKLLALSEFDAERIALEAEFKDYHLLRDRFEHFRGVFSSPKKVVEALDSHRLRLEWQIRRIYRARNIIVHSGQTPPYTRALIEHAHDYLDSVLSTLVKLASRPKTVNSVAQGFKHVELKYEIYYKNLTTKNIVFNAANIETLVLCR
jgi:hypothetical protein